MTATRRPKRSSKARGVPTFPLIEDAFKALDVLVQARESLKK